MFTLQPQSYTESFFGDKIPPLCPGGLQSTTNCIPFFFFFLFFAKEGNSPQTSVCFTGSKGMAPTQKKSCLPNHNFHSTTMAITAICYTTRCSNAGDFLPLCSQIITLWVTMVYLNNTEQTDWSIWSCRSALSHGFIPNPSEKMWIALFGVRVMSLSQSHRVVKDDKILRWNTLQAFTAASWNSELLQLIMSATVLSSLHAVCHACRHTTLKWP